MDPSLQFKMIPFIPSIATSPCVKPIMVLIPSPKHTSKEGKGIKGKGSKANAGSAVAGALDQFMLGKSTHT